MDRLHPHFFNQPEGNGRIQRAFRTLKEQLLWQRRFRTVGEFDQALRSFAHCFNNDWIIEHIG